MTANNLRILSKIYILSSKNICLFIHTYNINPPEHGGDEQISIALKGIDNYFNKKEIQETHFSEPAPKGFTFLNIGENTKISSDVREQLRDTLGPDAIIKEYGKAKF